MSSRTVYDLSRLVFTYLRLLPLVEEHRPITHLILGFEITSTLFGLAELFFVISCDTCFVTDMNVLIPANERRVNYRSEQ